MYLEQESLQLFSKSLEKGTSAMERSQMRLTKKPLSTDAWPQELKYFPTAFEFRITMHELGKEWINSTVSHFEL